MRWWYSAERRTLVVPTFGTFTRWFVNRGDACWVTTGDAVVPVPVRYYSMMPVKESGERDGQSHKNHPRIHEWTG